MVWSSKHRQLAWNQADGPDPDMRRVFWHRWPLVALCSPMAHILAPREFIRGSFASVAAYH